MNEQRTSSGPSASATRDLTGKTVGRFSVVARLATGGMGEVYRAKDNKLRRAVALKRISPELYADKKSRERLWKEALLVSRLNDPHIAGIYDAFEENDELFLVMEYIEGQTLRERLRSPMNVPEFLAVAAQCAAGVAAAHRAGIQHRDIKPENILLTPNGQVKILDFGISRRLPGADDASTREEQTAASISGSLGYMAPEILEQQPADERADIFSLGAVFYEALAGRNPFRAATFLETCHRLVHEDPPPVSEVNPQAPHEVDRIIGKMLAKLPQERYATAADIVVDLEALRRLPAKTAAITGEVAPKQRSHLAAWSLVAALVAALAFAGFFAYRRFQKPVLDEHASILITDFDNQTGNALLDQTATEATRQALDQSHYVRVIPRSQVTDALHRMGQSAVARVDRELGREICQRDNCRAVLAGAILKSDSHFEITEQIVDPVRDEAVLTETAAMNSPADLYSTVDTLSKNLRKHLGESLAQVEKTSQPLQQVTTPSLEALQRYSRAMDLFAAGDVEGSIPLAQSAIALDPNFAMAHLYLARAFGALGNEKAQNENLAAAKRGIGNVTERERYLILAEEFEFQEMYEKAADELRLLTEVYPDDLEAFRGLADVSLWTGRSEESVPAELHALELAPHSAADYLRLVLDYDRLNRFDEALAADAKARASGAASPLLYWGTGLAYLGKGDTKQARAAFQTLGKDGGAYGEDLASLYLARVLMYEGRLREATAELQNGLLLDQKMGSELYMPVRRYLLAETFLARGQTEKARTIEQRMAKDALESSVSEDVHRAGLISIELNDVPAARKLLDGLSEMRKERESGFVESCYYNLQGALDLEQKHEDGSAGEQIQAAVFFPLYAASSGLGDALVAKHDWNGAAQAYEKYLNFEGEIFHDDSPSDWVLAHLALARALARGGKKEEALKYYAQFLQLWANADSDLPALREARAERQQLIKAGPKSLSQGTAISGTN
ncbi:MAG TPA: protein kinase [Candidatus Acidoferrales bacterium]|nr:protein kinase [Candidatus Acidoferrales bacterium]